MTHYDFYTEWCKRYIAAWRALGGFPVIAHAKISAPLLPQDPDKGLYVLNNEIKPQTNSYSSSKIEIVKFYDPE